MRTGPTVRASRWKRLLIAGLVEMSAIPFGRVMIDFIVISVNFTSGLLDCIRCIGDIDRYTLRR